jgi:hypothetical protein
MWSLIYAAEPTMDSSVASALTDTVGGLETTVTGQLAAILPIAGIVLVSVVGLFFAIRAFRRVAHV